MLCRFVNDIDTLHIYTSMTYVECKKYAGQRVKLIYKGDYYTIVGIDNGQETIINNDALTFIPISKYVQK